MAHPAHSGSPRLIHEGLAVSKVQFPDGARLGAQTPRRSDAQAGERRPPVGTVTRRQGNADLRPAPPREAGRAAQCCCHQWRRQAKDHRAESRSAGSRHPGTGRLPFRGPVGPRCRPEVYTLRTSFSGPSGVRGTEGPGVPLPAAPSGIVGVPVEPAFSQQLGRVRLPTGCCTKVRLAFENQLLGGGDRSPVLRL